MNSRVLAIQSVKVSTYRISVPWNEPYASELDTEWPGHYKSILRLVHISEEGSIIDRRGMISRTVAMLTRMKMGCSRL